MKRDDEKYNEAISNTPSPILSFKLTALPTEKKYWTETQILYLKEIKKNIQKRILILITNLLVVFSE